MPIDDFRGSVRRIVVGSNTSCLVDHFSDWLYPGHGSPAAWHRPQAGFSSSHLNLLSLHRLHPVRDLGALRPCFMLCFLMRDDDEVDLWLSILPGQTFAKLKASDKHDRGTDLLGLISRAQ